MLFKHSNQRPKRTSAQLGEKEFCGERQKHGEHAKKEKFCKKQLKQALKNQTNEEDPFKIQSEFTIVIGLHNKMRNLVEKKNKRKERERGNCSFKKMLMARLSAFWNHDKSNQFLILKTNSLKFAGDAERDRDFSPVDNFTFAKKLRSITIRYLKKLARSNAIGHHPDSLRSPAM